jgi:hypothetical protein
MSLAGDTTLQRRARLARRALSPFARRVAPLVWLSVLCAVLVAGQRSARASAEPAAGLAPHVTEAEAEAAGGSGAPSCEPLAIDTVENGSELPAAGACVGAPIEAAPEQPRSENPDAGAPMCDRTGASIAATVEIPEVDRGRLEPLPCDAQIWLALSSTGPERAACKRAEGPTKTAPAESTPRERFDGTPTPEAPFPRRAAPRVVASASRLGLAFRAGHRAPIDRPPAYFC